jgi:hypothetical protein
VVASGLKDGRGQVERRATDVAILPVSHVSFRLQWYAGVSWWLDLRLTPDSAFDHAAKKGTF